MKNQLIASLLSVLPLLAAPCSAAEETKAPAEKEKAPVENAVTVFEPGKGNPYKSIRIPSIVSPDGKMIIAFAEGRYVDADQGKNDIIFSVSKNGGKTWSAPAVAAEAKGSTFNNPYVIYDKEVKQYILFFQCYPPGVSEQQGEGLPTGWSNPKSLRNYVCTSKDGKHWSKPKDVTSTTKHEDCSLTCSGPNPGVQLVQGAHQGRLVVVFNEAEKFGDWHITAAYSDDHGKTWQLGEKSEAGKGINEVSVVETGEGGLFVVARNYPNGGTKRVALSMDGGETWEEVTDNKELPCVNCQNSLTRYSFSTEDIKGGKSRILFSGPAGPGRSNGIIKISYDEGLTWKVEKSVGPGSFAYSALCPLEEGDVGLLYETDNKIAFTKFSLYWLTDGEDDYYSPKGKKDKKDAKEKKDKKDHKKDAKEKKDKKEKKDRKDKKEKKEKKDKKKGKDHKESKDADDDEYASL